MLVIPGNRRSIRFHSSAYSLLEVTYDVAMGWIWTVMVSAAALSGLVTGQGEAVGAAALDGAAAGIRLAVSLAGALCLWSGLMEVMRRSGITGALASALRPLLKRLFPKAAQDPEAAGCISANVTANLLGLGNAATPAGIAAVRRMRALSGAAEADDELCRLVVLNTASIQLLPTTVAAARAAAGCRSPFDILPAVWVTSLCSVAAGLLAARLLSRLWWCR